MVLVKTYQSYLPVITVLLLQNVFHLHGFVFGQTGQTGQTWCVFDQWLLKPNLGTFYNVNDAITLYNSQVIVQLCSSLELFHILALCSVYSNLFCSVLTSWLSRDTLMNSV